MLSERDQCRLLFFHGSFTVHATVIASHTVKYREPSKEAAMQRVQVLAAAIEREGASAIKK